MLEHITPERTANAIMQDTSFTGAYLVVEGMKDYKFYSKFIDVDKAVQIKQVGGKEKVKEVIELLNQRGFDRQVGVVDSDFDKILNNAAHVQNLYTTDYHDIEVMMFKSNALDTVLNIYVKKEKLENFLDGRKIEDVIIYISKKIGLLKLGNKVNNLGLCFKPERVDGNPLKYREFISDRDLTFQGDEKMILTVRNYSQNRGTIIADIEKINSTLKEVSVKTYDLEQLVNGHDLTNILYLFMKKVLRSTNRSLFDYNTIEDSLIMSYESRYFIDTQLFNSLYNWATSKKLDFFKGDILYLYSKIHDSIAV